MHTNNIAANTKLALSTKPGKGAAHMPRTAYNAANWQAITTALGKGPQTVAQLQSAIMAAAPNQQPHHAVQFVKYQVRNGNLVAK